MDLYYRAGEIKALKKVGYVWDPKVLQRQHDKLNAGPVKAFIRKHPGLAVGGAIGTGLGLNTLFSNKEPSPKMERPYLAGNPLSYSPQY